jgi:hypothetical protein
MKNFLARIMWKIQQLAITKLFELFVWIMISGAIHAFIIQYLIIQHLYTIYNNIFIFIFVYYAGYKILLD